MKRIPKKPAKDVRRFAQNMKKRRNALELSQEEVADRSGLHYTFIGRVERGEANVTLRSIIRIAKGLGCRAAELLEGV